MKDVIDVVEKAFLELSEKTAICPKRLVIDVEKHKGTAFFMPAYLGEMDALASKIVTNYVENWQRYGLPTPLASIMSLLASSYLRNIAPAWDNGERFKPVLLSSRTLPRCRELLSM